MLSRHAASRRSRWKVPVAGQLRRLAMEKPRFQGLGLFCLYYGPFSTCRAYGLRFTWTPDNLPFSGFPYRISFYKSLKREVIPVYGLGFRGISGLRVPGWSLRVRVLGLWGFRAFGSQLECLPEWERGTVRSCTLPHRLTAAHLDLACKP